jgi:hypothetical protein
VQLHVAAEVVCRQAIQQRQGWECAAPSGSSCARWQAAKNACLPLRLFFQHPKALSGKLRYTAAY